MSVGNHILVVEDNTEIASMLQRCLTNEGFSSEHVVDGNDAIESVKRHSPDLILLDRVIPGLTGDEVARQLKSDPRFRSIPIIMLTGKGEEADQLVGFALGADDYMAKPFSPKVLMARITARLRAKHIDEDEENQFTASSIELDRKQPRVFIDKTAVPLTATEYRILASLMAAAGTVLTSVQLLPMVYGQESTLDERSLAHHVDDLRRKLGPAAGAIQVVSDSEYAFCPPRAPNPAV